MTRPLRIEYNGAWYHVMNRGGGGRDIFRNDLHREMFLGLLQETSRMFSFEVHAYCLMDNHYHLLVHTPKGNLGRALRHLGGVYTQRFNRVEKIDGQLFRGRYKAILVEEGSYLLCISRYIHLNPVVAEMVNKPDQYLWSSYAAFIGEVVAPSWLVTHKTLEIIGKRNVIKRYKIFVESGLDDNTMKFYEKKKQAPVFGSEEFAVCLSKKYVSPEKEIPESRRALLELSIFKLVSYIAQAQNVDNSVLLKTVKGRIKPNEQRNMAIYVCRRYFGFGLKEIAEIFGLGHYSSASSVVTRFDKVLLQNNSLQHQIDSILGFIMSNAKT